MQRITPPHQVRYGGDYFHITDIDGSFGVYITPGYRSFTDTQIVERTWGLGNNTWNVLHTI